MVEVLWLLVVQKVSGSVIDTILGVCSGQRND